MKNNTQKRKRLVLSRTTIRVLGTEALAGVEGGNADITDKTGGSTKGIFQCVDEPPGQQ